MFYFSSSLRAGKYRKSDLHADFVGLFIRAEIRTKGNTDIKNSLIRIRDTDKSSKAKVLCIFYVYFKRINGHISFYTYFLSDGLCQYVFFRVTNSDQTIFNLGVSFCADFCTDCRYDFLHINCVKIIAY